MLLTTRDVQRERRGSLVADAVAVAERLSSGGIDNTSFLGDTVGSVHGISRISSQADLRSQSLPAIVEILDRRGSMVNDKAKKSSRKKEYKWHMTHYFYVHMALFIVNSFICGLIIYLIENYSSSRNRQIEVPYIDAWFVSSSCVYTCGLTTIDFAKLSVASQVILMFFTFISGITISTLPALAVKARTHKKVAGITVDDDHGDLEEEDPDELPTFNIRRPRNLPEHIREQIKSLPAAAQLRYRAYITCIALILGTCFAIYLIAFVAIGGWLSTHYTSEQLLQGNVSVNPWYISFIITITGFNQNGLMPFSDGFSRFLYDVYLNIFVILVVISGTSLFPFILRNIIIITRRLAPFRHKVIFDYILMNNHRLSTLLFPAVQTRIYLFVTILLYILGVSISLILDLHSPNFAAYPPGIRFLIFLFHTVNTRFAGFQTVDINTFASATLLIYLMLMATKPQMLCAIDESPFELSWLALQAQVEAHAQTTPTEDPNLPIRASVGSLVSGSSDGISPMKQMERFLRRQSFVTKDRARQEFSQTVLANGVRYKPQHLRRLRIRLFLIYFIRALIKHAFSFVLITRTWLFFFIFLICAIEYRRMAPVDPEITVFKIIFEIISAFGAVGLTLGYPNVSSSFSTVLTPASKTILVITMLMGRHRGLLASMEDQEAIEHSAIDLLSRRRDEILQEYENSQLNTNPISKAEHDEGQFNTNPITKTEYQESHLDTNQIITDEDRIMRF